MGEICLCQWDDMLAGILGILGAEQEKLKLLAFLPGTDSISPFHHIAAACYSPSFQCLPVDLPGSVPSMDPGWKGSSERAACLLRYHLILSPANLSQHVFPLDPDPVQVSLSNPSDHPQRILRILEMLGSAFWHEALHLGQSPESLMPQRSTLYPSSWQIHHSLYKFHRC